MRRALPLLLAALVILPLGCSRPQGDKESFCELAPNITDLFGLLQGFESADPAELDRRFDAGLEQYEALEQSAPRKIKPDVAELVDLVERVLDAVRENSDDRAAIAADLADLQDQHPGAAASGLRVIQYAKDNCDLDLQTGPVDSSRQTSTPFDGKSSTDPGGTPGSGSEPGSSTSTSGG